MVTGTLIVFFLAGGGVGTCEIHPLQTEAEAPFDVAQCELGERMGDEANEEQLAAIQASETNNEELFQHAQTMTFSVFIVYQLFNVMNCRSNRESAFKLGLFSNQWINYAFLFSLGLLMFFVQLAEHSIPFTTLLVGDLMSTTVLTATDWAIIFAVSGSVFIIDEFRKFIVNSNFFTPGSQ